MTEFFPSGTNSKVAADIGIADGQAGLMITGPCLAAAISSPLSIVVAGHTDRRILLRLA